MNNWLGGIYLKHYKFIWNIKLRERKAKWNLVTLIVLWIKWAGIVKIKHKDFIDVVSIMPYQN